VGESKRVSIKDVAQAAGVSITTVSHTLSGARAVAPATRDQVMAAIERLGYRPDPFARGLRGHRSYVLGLVGDRVITTPHTSTMVLGAQSAAAARGSFVAAVDSGGNAAVEEQQIRGLTDHRVDGVIYARMHHQSVALPPSVGGTPVVLLDASSADGLAVSSIVPNEPGIAETAVRLLAGHGHRRIGFMTATGDAPAIAGREAGYRRAMADAGLAVDDTLVQRADHATAASGRILGRRLLERRVPPTAVLCFNDQMAMGLYQAAARVGVGIPADLSVVGVDNLPLVAEALDPGLTTVAVPHFAMGQWAVNRLLDLIEDPGSTPCEQVELACPLVERGSVGPPPSD
jgi:LacI family transcriptional regulator